MGQTLSEPVKEKLSHENNDSRLAYASSAMQGWRISMEDAHTTELQLAGRPGYSFFGVYDGHGGQNVAKYSGSNLHKKIANDPKFKENTIEDAIKGGFLAIDEDLKKDPSFAKDPSGCTAVISVISPDGDVYVGNSGDSRAVISIDGNAKDMSIDHKPVNKEESDRILKAGGFVEFGRVNGNLALSRAIGDFEFKQNATLGPKDQIVTAHPDVQKIRIEPKTEFLVIACDGIWDCLTSQKVISFIRHELSEKATLKSACENLMERCLAKDSELGGIGCDNMTVIIVAFLQGKTLDEWYKWMADRYGKVGPEYSDDVEQKNHPEDYSSMDDENEQDLEIPERVPEMETNRSTSISSHDSNEDDTDNYDIGESGELPITPNNITSSPPVTPVTPNNISSPRKDSNSNSNNSYNNNNNNRS